METRVKTEQVKIILWGVKKARGRTGKMLTRFCKTTSDFLISTPASVLFALHSNLCSITFILSLLLILHQAMFASNYTGHDITHSDSTTPSLITTWGLASTVRLVWSRNGDLQPN